jgi:hypothetical protein
MADGYFPTLVSKDEDPNAAGDPIYVQLTDGTAVLSSTGTSLDVNVTNTSIPVTGTFWQTTQPISGSVTVSNAGGGAAVNIQDGGNTITVDGSVSITGSVTVTASDLDIRNLTLTDDAVKVSANSTANSVSNPIFVALGSGPITGEVHSYDATSVTTTGNHDYPVTTAMLVKSVECSASGGAKFELMTGPVASLVSKWTGFVPKAGGTVSAHFDPPIEVPVTSTGTVRIVRTNRESQAQSIYTTIVGIDA